MNMDAMDEVFSQEDMDSEPFPLEDIYQDPSFIARVDALAVKDGEACGMYEWSLIFRMEDVKWYMIFKLVLCRLLQQLCASLQQLLIALMMRCVLQLKRYASFIVNFFFVKGREERRERRVERRYFLRNVCVYIYSLFTGVQINLP